MTQEIPTDANFSEDMNECMIKENEYLTKELEAWVSKNLSERRPKIKEVTQFILTKCIGIKTIIDPKQIDEFKFERNIKLMDSKGDPISERTFTYDLKKYYKNGNN